MTRKGIKIKHRGTERRVLNWAKEYGKHFCLHDASGFSGRYHIEVYPELCRTWKETEN
jgi:hypothetical protein